ncbi:DUF952 domain-containing protein [Aquipuribacter sp. MA13-6]|uniref:DUF952 domain-containing protein n=1 Tax=unclassified Aquipuribacter TaxID=2635084 RepID=UPI003EE8E03B
MSTTTPGTTPSAAPGPTPALLHLALPEEWQEAVPTGSYDRSTRGLSLGEVGFVHCAHPHQVEAVAARFYGDLLQDPDATLLVLHLDPERLDVHVVHEDLEGTGEQFPHVYGPLPVDAVVRVEAMARVDGAWRLPLS